MKTDQYKLELAPVVCFGDSDWWYHNRGHMDMQFMKQFALFVPVLYVNSIVVRKLNLTEGTMFIKRVKRKLASIRKGLTSSGVKNMHVYSPFTMPVHHIPFARALNDLSLCWQVKSAMKNLSFKKPLIWVTCPGAAQTAVKIPHSKLVYQRSDCYEEFPDVDVTQLKKYDQMLKKHADLVIYANKNLMQKEKSQCLKAVYLDHGVDFEHFANAQNDMFVPSQMKDIPSPIAGFYGGIDPHTSDLKFIEEVTDLLADVSVVMIGNSSVDLTSLKKHKNFFHLCQKPYEILPHYAKLFDVCFMAWNRNNWIKACNPVKLKEYLALGKPVVSTPFPELSPYSDLVNIADNPQDFAAALKNALETNDPEKIFARKNCVYKSTWQSKSGQVIQTLYNVKLPDNFRSCEKSCF